MYAPLLSAPRSADTHPLKLSLKKLFHVLQKQKCGCGLGFICIKLADVDVKKNTEGQEHLNGDKSEDELNNLLQQDSVLSCDHHTLIKILISVFKVDFALQFC